MNRNVTKRDIVTILVIGVAVLLFFTVPNFFDNSSQNEPPVYTPPVYTPPNFTASQAMGVVVSAINASTPTIQRESGWFETKFNSSTRQWITTVWSSENASKEYAGAVYIVDDATGKLLNPPPVYTPK